MKKIAYVINNVGFFVSHRLPLAEEALKRKMQVSLITGLPGSKIIEEKAVESLKKHNIKHYRIPFSSQGVNPLKEAKALFSLIKHLRTIKPNIVHAASPKGLLHASLSSLFIRLDLLVLSVSGMGFLYTSLHEKTYIRMIKFIFKLALFIVVNIKKTVIIVQNEDDFKLYSRLIFFRKSSLKLIPGSGVDIQQYRNISININSKIVLFPARVLVDKGAREFVEAAKIIRSKGYDWDFVIVGASDYQNPSAIKQDEIDQWIDQGIVQWWGHQDEMLKVYQKSAIVCLPSYREGMPKTLLEAAAIGLPIVTTDVVGCREAIIPNHTGLLVPSHDPVNLAIAIEHLISDPDLRFRMGLEGSKLAKKKFSLDRVKSEIQNIYSHGIVS